MAKQVKIMKRAQLLTKNNEELVEAQLAHQVATDQLQIQSDLLATQQSLNTRKIELLALKSAPTLSPSVIIIKQDEIAGLEAGLKSLKKLEKELF